MRTAPKFRWLKPSAVLLALAMLSAPCAAQNFWSAKNYKLWTEKECRKLLADSPWARSQLIGTLSLRVLQLEPPTGNPPTTGPPGRESNPRIKYTAQARSAMPVRQAIVRLQQIAARYSAMSADQQRAFDDQAQKYLGTSFADSIVIFVEYASNVQPFQTDVGQHWQTMTVEQARNQIFLITDSGQKLPSTQFVHQRDSGFHLVFSRLLDGEPVISPRAKSFKLEFPHPNIGELGSVRVLLTFHLAKMEIEGKPAF